MPIPTDYTIKCRGCGEGAHVPLFKKSIRRGEGRFYYGHGRGCLHSENFDPDIADIDTLRRCVPGLDIRKKALSTTSLTPLETAEIPLAKENPPKETVTAETPKEMEGEENGFSFF